jgi:hypothetical protein
VGRPSDGKNFTKLVKGPVTVVEKISF